MVLYYISSAPLTQEPIALSVLGSHGASFVTNPIISWVDNAQVQLQCAETQLLLLG